MLHSKACTDVMQKLRCCNAKATFFFCRCIANAKVTLFYFSCASSFVLGEEALAQADILWRDLDQLIVVDEV